MNKTKAYSAASATSLLASDTIPRRAPTGRDLQIEIPKDQGGLRADGQVRREVSLLD